MTPRRVFHLPWRTARQIRADVDAELDFHITTRVEELVARGAAPGAARAQAAHEFGDIDDARSYMRAVDTNTEAAHRRNSVMEDLRHDCIYAWRRIRSAPAFAAAVIATLALGIGATTAIFSVVNGVLLEPLPYPHSERIVQLFQVNGNGARNSVSQPNFHDWAAQTRSFSSMALWDRQGDDRADGTGSVTPSSEKLPTEAHIVAVTRQFFAVLGVQPEIGRVFNPEETRFGGRPAAVVSDRFWREHFGAHAGNSGSLDGARLTIQNIAFDIVGVVPRDMNYPAETDVWLTQEIFPPNTGRTSGGHYVIARLQGGVTIEMARRDVSAVSRRLKLAFGSETTMSDAVVVPLRDQLVGSVKLPLIVLFAASLCLLIIACANASSLLLARLALREGEFAVRVALGASRARLVRQVLTESSLLVLVSAALGVAIAGWGVGAMLLRSTAVPRSGEVHIDLRVLAFAAGVAGCVALSLGLLAALQGTRRNVRGAMSANQRSMTGSRSGARLRRGMVVAQVALTVVLLAGAGVLGRSFLHLLEINPGFRRDNVLVVNAAPTIEDPTARVAYYTRLSDLVQALPGVVSAAVSTGVPIAGSGPDGTYLLLDNAAQSVAWQDWTRTPLEQKGTANYYIVTAGYFDALGIPLRRGRTFRATDRPDAPPVAVVSETFAKRSWPGQDPIGKVVEFGNMDSDLRPFSVVGVAGDVRDESLSASPSSILYAYLPQRTHGGWGMTLVVRTRRDPMAIAGSVRSIVHDLHPEVAVTYRTMDRVLAASVADRRFTLLLIAVFGGTALVLSMLGVYSVVSYLVAQRTPEIGVRVALGANAGDVVRLVLREGTVLAGLGIAIGVTGALLLTRVIKGMIYDVSATDPVAFAAVVILLAGVALVASYIPAHRAAGVSPTEVLKNA